MQISLEEAIEIQARVLSKRHRNRAADSAREYAQARKEVQDFEGYAIWSRVAEAAERLSEEISGSTPCRHAFCDSRHHV